MSGRGIIGGIRLRDRGNDVAVKIDEHRFIRTGADVMRNDILHIAPLLVFGSAEVPLAVIVSHLTGNGVLRNAYAHAGAKFP